MKRAASRAAGRTRRRQPRSPWVAAGAAIVIGAGLVTLANNGTGAQTAYTVARVGDVSASVSAAGNVQTSDMRDLAFGTTGTVEAVDVQVGQRVAGGQTLARLDPGAAQDQVTAAQAALAAADYTYDQALAGGSSSGGSSSGSSGTTTASSSGSSGSCGSSGNSGGSSGSSGTTATATATLTDFVGPKPTPAPRPARTTPTSAPTPTPSPSASGTTSPTPTPSPTGSPTPSPTTTSPTTLPTSPRPTTKRSRPPGGRQGGRPGPNKGKGRPTGTKTGRSGTAGAKGGGSSCADPIEQADAQVAKARAALDEADQTLAETKIVAPMAGTILAVNGTAGDVVTGAGTSGFITIGDMTSLEVRAMFSLKAVDELRIGEPAQVSFAAFPGRQYTGEIAEIDPAATLSGELALFGVSIALDDGTPNGLVNGMSASSNVVTARAPDAVYVPADAVTSEPDGTSAVLVRKGDTTTLRAVRIGVRGDQYIQITAGLKPGDRVVLAASAGSDGWPGDTFPGA